MGFYVINQLYLVPMLTPNEAPAPPARYDLSFRKSSARHAPNARGSAQFVVPHGTSPSLRNHSGTFASLTCFSGTAWVYRAQWLGEDKPNLTSSLSIMADALLQDETMQALTNRTTLDGSCIRWSNALSNMWPLVPVDGKTLRSDLSLSAAAMRIVRAAQLPVPTVDVAKAGTEGHQLELHLGRFFGRAPPSFYHEITRAGISVPLLAKFALSASLCAADPQGSHCVLYSQLNHALHSLLLRFGEISVAMRSFFHMFQSNNWQRMLYPVAKPKAENVDCSKFSPSRMNIIWGPHVHEPSLADLHQTQAVPLLAQEASSTLDDPTGPNTTISVLYRQCNWRIGYILFLPSLAEFLSSNSTSYLLVALLQAREHVVFVGKSQLAAKELINHLANKFGQTEFPHTKRFLAMPKPLLAGRANALADSHTLMAKAGVKYIAEVDLSSGVDLSLHPTEPRQANMVDYPAALQESFAALAELRLQLCKWHPAVAIIGSSNEAQLATIDGYDLFGPFMSASVIIFDVDAAKVASSSPGAGGFLGALPHDMLRRESKQAIRAARAAAAAVLFAQYTMVLPGLFAVEQSHANAVNMDRQAIAQALSHVRSALEEAAGNTTPGCKLDAVVSMRAIDRLICHTASNDTPDCSWAACRRIGNGFKFSAHLTRRCVAPSLAIWNPVRLQAESFLTGAGFSPSTLGAEECVRTALGLFGLFGNWNYTGHLLTKHVVMPLRPHPIFGVPHGTHTQAVEQFLPGAVAYDLGSELPLRCWVHRAGLNMSTLLSADAQTNNMYTGLSERNNHVMDQHRDHAAILAMLWLTEQSYGFQHDMVLSQRTDVIWLREALQREGQPWYKLGNGESSWPAMKLPPQHSCLVGDRAADYMGLCDHTAICARSAYPSYASAVQHIRANGFHAVAASVDKHAHTTNAESFLSWRLAQGGVHVIRDGHVFTRACDVLPPANRSVTSYHVERSHGCVWQPNLQLWGADEQTGFISQSLKDAAGAELAAERHAAANDKETGV